MGARVLFGHRADLGDHGLVALFFCCLLILCVCVSLSHYYCLLLFSVSGYMHDTRYYVGRTIVTAMLGG